MLCGIHRLKSITNDGDKHHEINTFNPGNISFFVIGIIAVPLSRSLIQESYQMPLKLITLFIAA